MSTDRNAVTFPEGFTWGTATSSYQIEGGRFEGGRGETIWDEFSHTSGKTRNGDTGDTACDHYHRFREDVKLLQRLGVKAYRFSIAWSRIQPLGFGQANPEGISFYNQLIDELLKNGIEPWVTLYHWDLPLELHTRFNGWLNPGIAGFFGDYADVCFRSFGDRVKRWITVNEAWVVSACGYGIGEIAPGIISGTAPYIAGHNLLRAHGKAVEVYRSRYQATQGGIIGITNNCDWREPATDAPADFAAAQRALEFFLGWFADPIYLGDYPAAMRTRLKDRLPEFSREDAALIFSSNDFFGLNHYSTNLAADAETSFHDKPQESRAADLGQTVLRDPDVLLSSDPTWRKTAMGWNVVPGGLEKLLCWISDRYGSPKIFITENGCATCGHDTETLLNDDFRIDFIDSYLRSCLRAIERGVDLKGYFLWSLLDNFEWSHGYSKRFGLHHVDFETLERTPRKSASWYSRLIETNGMPD